MLYEVYMLDNLFSVYKYFLSHLFINDIGACSLYLLMGIFTFKIVYRIISGKL